MIVVDRNVSGVMLTEFYSLSHFFPLFFRQRLVAKSTIETALSLTRLLVHFMSLNPFTPQVTIDKI